MFFSVCLWGRQPGREGEALPEACISLCHALSSYVPLVA